MRRLRANLIALVGGLLMGGVLAFASSEAFAVSTAVTSGGNVTAGSINVLTSRISGISFSKTGQVLLNTVGGSLSASQGLPATITTGAVPTTVQMTASRTIPAAVARGLAVGALRGSVQGIVIGAGVNAAINAAGYECDLTGCYQVGGMVEDIVDATIESVPATQSPAGTVVGTINTWYYPNNSPTQKLNSFSETCDAIRAAMGAQKQTCTDTETKPTPIAVDARSAGTCRRYNYSSCNQTSVGPTVQSACDEGYSMTYPGGVATCKNGQPVDTCPAGFVTPLNGQCQRLVCPAGYELNGTQCTALINNPRILVEDGVVHNNSGIVLTPEDQKAIVEQALAQGMAVPADDPVITGDPVVTSSPVTKTQTTTRTNAEGQSVTTTEVINTTTTVNNTYQGNTATSTVVNNTTTTTTDDDPATSDTTEETKDPVPDAPVVDTELDQVPELYKRKYPDGIKGVWTAKNAELQSTPLFGLSAVFTPNIAGGSCPSWTFDANIGPAMNFGQGNIAPPCWIWPLIKGVVLITALLLARSLIFGG